MDKNEIVCLADLLTKTFIRMHLCTTAFWRWIAQSLFKRLEDSWPLQLFALASHIMNAKKLTKKFTRSGCFYSVSIKNYFKTTFERSK